jgi:hypothetical protein
MRDGHWAFPALVAADASDLDAGASGTLEPALDFCRSCLAR